MMRRQMRDPVKVYFIRPVGKAGPVKIGCSSLPKNRLASLTAWSPYPLEIVAMIEGDETLERRFHAAFMSCWSHSEWFNETPELTETIAAVAAGTFDITSLPPARRICGQRKGNGWSEYSRLSASMSARLRALEQRGVEVPKNVSAVAYRYNCGPYSRTNLPLHQPADAHFVQAFLAKHGYEPRPVPANDVSPSSEAA